jgi:DNA-binding NtrC family response regulator
MRALESPTAPVSGVWRQGRPVDDTWSAPDDRGAPTLIGRSPVMAELRRRLECVATSARPVLLLGPTGAGKELAAQTVHCWSQRAGEPRVDVNCGAIPEHLAESELFGHERGAFTGADRRRDGVFAEVRGGTLFLDEVAELTLPVQVKLLRVLETGRFRPVGGGAEQRFAGRVVAATNTNLAEAVRRGTFREDLHHRLRVLPVEVPALAARREDIPLLVEHFLGAQERRCFLVGSALAALVAFDWPGNVRQLRNVMERLALFAHDGLIDEAVVQHELACEGAGGVVRAIPCELQEYARRVLAAPVRDKLAAAERALIDEALRDASGNKSEAARLLGVHRKVIERAIGRRDEPATP